jgi:hypothetical protein
MAVPVHPLWSPLCNQRLKKENCNFVYSSYLNTFSREIQKGFLSFICRGGYSILGISFVAEICLYPLIKEALHLPFSCMAFRVRVRAIGHSHMHVSGIECMFSKSDFDVRFIHVYMLKCLCYYLDLWYVHIPSKSCSNSNDLKPSRWESRALENRIIQRRVIFQIIPNVSSEATRCRWGDAQG